MSSNTLDGLGRAVLEAIDEGRTGPGAIADAVEAAPDAVEERLAQLVDNALVRQVDGAYELTENGERVLSATPIGASDNRIDTPAEVEVAIAGLSLRPDEAAAVRNAFSFLRYWGEATTAEIVDAGYSAVPAGYDAADRWWTQCVEDALASLPRVERTPSGSGPELWRYEGESVIERPLDRDGREVGEEGSDPASLGSVRHGIERSTTTAEERAAARAAFATLFDRGRADAADLLARVYDDYPAGFDSPSDWIEWLADVFDALPGIERDDGAEDLVFSYDPTASPPSGSPSN